MQSLQPRDDVALPALPVPQLESATKIQQTLESTVDYPALRSQSLEDWLQDDAELEAEADVHNFAKDIAFYVKNTFIEFPAHSPLHGCMERQAQSCPGSGLMPHLAPRDDAPAPPLEIQEEVTASRIKPLTNLFLQYLSLRCPFGSFGRLDKDQWEQSTTASSDEQDSQDCHGSQGGQASQVQSSVLDSASTNLSSLSSSDEEKDARNPVILNLSDGLGIMSIGSATHDLGQCTPCAFLWKGDGCTKGQSCGFCHLCPPGEVKRRKKEKLASRKATQQAQAGRAMHFGRF